MRFSLVLLLFILTHAFSFSQSVIRGPYLQKPTDNSIVVMWRTDQFTDTKVWYGSSPSNLNQTIYVNNSATDHSIIITGLDPYTQYYYAVGTNTGILSGASVNHFFRTHPVPGTEQFIRVWALGDFGKGNTGQIDVKTSYLNYSDTINTDVWIWLGDNAYNDGKDDEYQNKVFGLSGFSDVFSWLPFYPSPGNHDYMEVWSESTLLGIPYSNIPLQDHTGPYYDIVDVPQFGEAGGEPSLLEVFYSFDYGNVHFLSLNSEVYDFAGTDNGINQMIDWITQDLQQNDKLFTIAYFHQPPYSKGSHDSDDAFELVMKAMREKVIPVLESFDIDLVICGHSHVYERSFLINGHYGNSASFDPFSMLKDGSNGNFILGNAYIKDTLNNNDEGTVYVVCGNGGSSDSNPDLNYPAMAFSDGGSSVYGSFMLDIYKNRLDGKYLRVNGTIMDDFTILKKNLSISPFPDYTICEGDSITLIANYQGGSDDLTFNWTGIPGDTAIQTISPVSSGNYSVSITDNLTGQVVSDTFVITVVPIPTATITLNNDTLFAPAGFSYQWYLNGFPISGANLYFHVPTQSGNYTVELINGVCSDFSGVLNFTYNSVSEILKEGIKIYPNPSSLFLKIEFEHPELYSELTFYNLLGEKMIYVNPVTSINVVSLDQLSSGIYFLNCSGKQKSVSFKIIVEK